jgi:FtsH-binding integral membrane protein
MEPNKLKNKTQKVANAMIIGMVVIGTVIFSVINQISSGAELMPKLFLIFFGAIITVQVIPGLILMGTMIKGVVSFSQKKQEPAKATATSSEHK